jgi:hypothetical protein
MNLPGCAPEIVAGTVAVLAVMALKCARSTDITQPGGHSAEGCAMNSARTVGVKTVAISAGSLLVSVRWSFSARDRSRGGVPGVGLGPGDTDLIVGEGDGSCGCLPVQPVINKVAHSRARHLDNELRRRTVRLFQSEGPAAIPSNTRG